MIAVGAVVFLSTVIVSLISFIGIFSIIFKKNFFQKILSLIISFAAGTMLATTFFDLLPESFELLNKKAFFYMFLGIITFFLIEQYIHWHHCNSGRCEKKHNRPKPFVYLNIIGDGLHNLIDGGIIAASYLTNMQLGIITTISIASHEIPQEIGDFSILVHGGLSIKKALLYNLLSALFAVLGVFLTLFFASSTYYLTPLLLSIAAGGFVYLSLADIIPEIQKESEPKKIVLQTFFIFFGIILIYLLMSILPE